MNMKTHLLITLITATLLAGLSPLNAQVLEESFQSPLGGLPDGWTRYKGADNAPDDVAEISQLGEDRYLTLTRRRGSTSNPTNFQAAVFYTGSSPSNTFSNAQGTITVRHGANLSSSNKSGVVVRSQNRAWANISGYYLTYDRDFVSIWHDPRGHNNHGTLMGQSALLSSLDTDTDYLFHFSFIGSILSATLTTLEDTLIGTVTVDTSDSQYSSLTQYTEGSFGLRIAYGSTNSPTYFKDLTLTSQIPEPATAALMVVPFLSFLLWRRRIRVAL